MGKSTSKYVYEGPAEFFNGVARGGEVELTEDQVIWSGLNGGHTFRAKGDKPAELMPADDPFTPVAFVGEGPQAAPVATAPPAPEFSEEERNRQALEAGRLEAVKP